MSVKAKAIQLFLVNGTLDGILTIAEPDWIGKIVSAPRARFDELLKREEVSQAGVYFLLSDTKVYIGQSQSSIKSRLQQHNKNKSWWDRVIFVTHNSNSFTSTDVQYFEQKFIELANKAGTNTDNQTVGNKFHIDEWNQANDDNFINEVLILFAVIGIHVFDRKKVRQTIQESVSKVIESRSAKQTSVVNQFNSNKLIKVYIMTSPSIDADATGIYDTTTERITILRGSRISKKTGQSFRTGKYDQFINERILNQDLVNLSVSTAAAIVYRRAADGWLCWKDENGATMAQLFRKGK